MHTVYNNTHNTCKNESSSGQTTSVFHQATQANSASCPRWDMGSEYQPKCGDVLRLGNKGMYGSFHFVDKCVGGRCDPSLPRAIPERLYYEQLIIKHYTNEAPPHRLDVAPPLLAGRLTISEPSTPWTSSSCSSSSSPCSSSSAALCDS